MRPVAPSRAARWSSLLVLPLALSAGCVAEVDDACSAARDTVEACYGAGEAADFVCDPDLAADLASRSCEELASLDAKSDGLLCEKLGLFCPEPPIFPEPSGTATAHPIVLAHGLNASPDNEWGVHPAIVEALRADGHAVHVAQVAPFQSVEVRAAQLGEEVDRALAAHDAEAVNLVAHSMGGLDARYLVSQLGYHDRVRSVTTISSPHRGSRIADVALGLVGGPVEAALDALAELWAGRYSRADLAEGSSLRAALGSLTEAGADAFNAATPDVPGVHYQSWAGVSTATGLENADARAACTEGGGAYLVHDGGTDRLTPRLWPMAPFVAHGIRSLPHDGMATVASARWGAFRGCVPADHYDEVGQVDAPGYRKSTGFDAIAFHRTIAFDLAAAGF